MTFKRPYGAGLAALAVGLFAATAAYAEPTVNKGDNAWMLTSTVLVLLMTIPGLALFYGGLVRTKNMLSVLMQVFYTVCIVTILWALYGYSLAFTGGSDFIGGFSKAFLMGVTPDSKAATFSVDANITELVYICFQMTFAAITPALIVGAFAERMKFAAVALFIPLWVTLIYFPIAHMVWYWAGPDAITDAAKALAAAGDEAAKKAAQAKLDEVMADAGWIFKKGAIDFAGGTVVHINAGIAGLVGALLIGKRTGYGKELMAPHSLTMSMIGRRCARHDQLLRCYGSGGAGLDVRGMDRPRSPLDARRHLRRGGRPRCGHACRRLRRSDGCDRTRPRGRRGLPVLLYDREELARL
jgi:ammonium transporter, Amt family